MYFVSKNSAKPTELPSLPRPLSFTPPKGATAEDMIPSLIPINPFSSLLAEKKKKYELQEHCSVLKRNMNMKSAHLDETLKTRSISLVQK